MQGSVRTTALYGSSKFTKLRIILILLELWSDKGGQYGPIGFEYLKKYLHHEDFMDIFFMVYPRRALVQTSTIKSFILRRYISSELLLMQQKIFFI